MSNLLRSCAGCSAHLLVNDGVSDKAWCPKCRPKYVKPFEEWAASLAVRDLVYVQPSVTRYPTAEHIIMARDGEKVILQPLGLPGVLIETTIGQLGQHSMVRR